MIFCIFKEAMLSFLILKKQCTFFKGHWDKIFLKIVAVKLQLNSEFGISVVFISKFRYLEL